MSNYDYMNNIIKTFSGDKRTITIPKIYLEITEDYPTAAFLNQLIYWSDKSKRKDGYFYKKYEEWNEEILLSNYQIRRITKILENMGFITTSLKKANGVPTKHYKVNMDNIQNAIVNKLDNGMLRNLTMDYEETKQSLDCEETKQSLTVNYSNNYDSLNTNTDAFKNASNDTPNTKDKTPYKEVIEYLNEKAGKNFNHKAKGNKKFISARYNEGNSLEDFKYVIDVKVADWLNDKHMKTYLKPETLFNSTNFEKYKNETIEEINERKQYWENKPNKNNNRNSYNKSNSWIDDEIEKLKGEQ